MKILLTHANGAFERYYGAAPLAELEKFGVVHRNLSDAVMDDRALVDAARGCDLIIADRATPVSEAALAELPDLLAVHRCAVDISTIAVPAASRHGVLVTRASAGFADAAAELAIGMMIDLGRGISAATGAYRAGAQPRIRMGTQLRGATLGIVGYGAIGRRLAKLAQGFGLAVLAHDPFLTIGDPGIEQVAFGALLGRSDFVVCLAPATPETHHLFNAAAFAAMRPGSFFLNLARSSIVDEAALTAALASGALTGAAVDVGPARDEMPSLALAARPDVVATPHIGGLTPQAVQHQSHETVRQVAALVAGRMPEGAVNPDCAARLYARGILRR
ncbi:hydroxyacid dehydrogenase [Bosea caraganae]|uniref:Hydroxyacid dehydrogenase n=2 Tax=Bosea caraganae TaxID=2763117 RepID=A0A370L1C9_9HYPH|nr:hydroxyacid dehydrogenase [Bosea caraganae]RDJ26593.1 hydroxyacid dehydrogenase [Bosea caraganae]